MERPLTRLAFVTERRSNAGRIVGLALVIALHVGFVYALISGLAVRAVTQLPQELFAQVVVAPPPIPQPPPLAPSLAQPTLPSVAAPQIRIEAPQGEAHPITVYVGAPKAAAASSPAPASTPAVAIEKTHTIPPYPISARRLGQKGIVRLSLTVSPDGSVSDATIMVSSGMTVLDDVARRWVRDHWRYKPAMLDGHAVSTTLHANVVFDLTSA